MNIFEGIEDYKWMFIQTQRPAMEVAGLKIEMNNSDWDKFWKLVSQKRFEIFMHEKSIKIKRVKLPCGKVMDVDCEELDFIEDTFGEPANLSYEDDEQV